MNLKKKSEIIANIKKIISFLYGKDKVEWILSEIEFLIKKFQNDCWQNTKYHRLDEKDIYLIIYGDNIRENGRKPLKTLNDFLVKKIKGIINNIHILPFYPYSSDDGFSIIDYFKVNPRWGSWQDILELAKNFKLMFDAVINHISSESKWFKGYLAGDEKYKNFFIKSDPDEDLSIVTRPRTCPLLTKFESKDGEVNLWTTFSEDQIDLNYKNENVLLNIIRLLFFYLQKGAKSIRLDAIGYLWKKKGTKCIHLEETHKIIQLFRLLFDIVSPDTIIITETNVSHKENISYFGNGSNEAQMVYQFSLPPLVLHAYQTGNASYLTSWANSLNFTSNTNKTCFFNFLASHDGIGIMPVKDIIPKEEVNKMCERVKENGGLVSYKSNKDGTESPYELNINYFDALSIPGESEKLRIKKFMATQAILLSFTGVPAIYIHSLIGSTNYHNGVKESGQSRSINREKLDKTQLEEELDEPDSLRHKIFHEYTNLIRVRKKEKAFHPNAEQEVVFTEKAVFSFIRKSKTDQEYIIAVYNVSQKKQKISIKLDKYGINTDNATDLFTANNIKIKQNKLDLTLDVYQYIWIKCK